MDSLNHDNQADDIEAFNSTSRYLDDLLNIDNLYYAPNFEEVEGAYWFGSVRAVSLSVSLSVCDA